MYNNVVNKIFSIKLLFPSEYNHYRVCYTWLLVYVTIHSTGYVALNLKDLRHYAHCIVTLFYMMGYSINYGFGLLLSSQNMLLLVAVYFLVVTPAYLLAEWLSNQRSIAHCLGSSESSHNNDDIVAK